MLPNTTNIVIHPVAFSHTCPQVPGYIGPCVVITLIGVLFCYIVCLKIMSMIRAIGKDIGLDL